MSLDEGLLRDAEAARARLIESQHAAEQARADYQHAIRRLHAAGGSLREIAEALRLSHQRVHQIIDEAAEPTRPWWRRRGRRWRGPAGPCSFCGRSRQQGARLIAGPGVFICERCVAQASRLAGGAPLDEQVEVPLRVEPADSQLKCSFCGKRTGQVRRVVASMPGGKPAQVTAICDECLALCEEILAEPASS